MVNLLWSGLLQIIISIILIWRQLGLATISGVGVMLFTMLPNSIISSQTKKSQSKQMLNKDERCKLLTEALTGIKVLKIYAWTEAFIKRINDFRLTEVASLKKIMICFTFMSFSFSVAPFLVSLASFGTYVFVYTGSNEQLDANKIFVSLSLFNIIRNPLGLLPIVLTNGMMCFVSIR